MARFSTRSALALIVVWVLGAVACAPTVPAESPSAPPVTEGTEPTTVEQTEPERRIVDADGVPTEFVEVESSAESAPRSYEVVRTHDQRLAVDENMGVLGLGADGVALVSLGYRSDFDAGIGEMAVADRIGAWTDDGVEEFPSAADVFADELPRQAVTGVVTEDYFVWHETTSTDLYFDSWRIFSRPRAGGPIALIAQSEQMFPEGPHPQVAGWLELTASDEEVAWRSSYRRDDGAIRSAVVSVPVGGGDLTVEQEIATFPDASDAGWVTVRMNETMYPDDNADQVLTDSDRLTGIDLVERAREPVPMISLEGTLSQDWYIAQIAAGGRMFAWQIDSSIYVASIDGDFYYRIDPEPGRAIESWSLTICSGQVSWLTRPGSPTEWVDGSNEMHAFDPSTATLRAIDTEHSPNFLQCAGDYASWQEFLDLNDPEEPARLVVARWTD